MTLGDSAATLGGGIDLPPYPPFTLDNGDIRFAELHRYQAHGIARREVKCKRYLDGP